MVAEPVGHRFEIAVAYLVHDCQWVVACDCAIERAEFEKYQTHGEDVGSLVGMLSVYGFRREVFRSA